MSEEITDANFSQKTAHGKVVVDFYAEWCGPCKLMKPAFDKASQEFKDVHFFKIDVDENPNSAEEFGVRSIPTIVFLREGKEVERAIGFSHEEVLKEKIKKSLQ